MQASGCGVPVSIGLCRYALGADETAAMKESKPPVLDPTGERMVPESADTFTFWEHVYRYAFASRFVRGKRILDIACGEGYGAAALQKAGAAQVIGVDIDESVCLHARNKYGLDARPGTAERIPLPDKSVDVVISFETIEHVTSPNLFLDECARVLAPGGRLVISTPNKLILNQYLGGYKNPYHCSEMTPEELASAFELSIPGHSTSTHSAHSPRPGGVLARSFARTLRGDAYADSSVCAGPHRGGFARRPSALRRTNGGHLQCMLFWKWDRARMVC